MARRTTTAVETATIVAGVKVEAVPLSAALATVDPWDRVGTEDEGTKEEGLTVTTTGSETGLVVDGSLMTSGCADGCWAGRAVGGFEGLREAGGLVGRRDAASGGRTEGVLLVEVVDASVGVEDSIEDGPAVG